MARAEKILYFDCFAGISGDMTMAALVDLGVPEEQLRAGLARLGLPGWQLRLTRDSRHGIGGTRADVDLSPTPLAAGALLAPARAAHEHGHEHHEHRSWRDIRAMIEGGGLDAGVKARALAIFGKLAEAEAKVHGVSVADVSFHEVGAVDSIVDIVAAAICLEYLAPDRVLCSSVELGGGFVKCQHGLIPVPAPAVVELLAGVPVKSGATQKETTTPTGAAILAASVDEFTDDKRFRITRSAYGIGHRDDEIPNVLRVFLGERVASEASPRGSEGSLRCGEGALLECNIDDMSPESHGFLIERLFAAGADDVWITPIVMKKNRSAITLSAMCALDKEEALAEAILRESTSIGLRRSRYEKTALERETTTVATSLGEVRVKSAYLRGEKLKSKPEYEDLRAIAEKRGMSIEAVLGAIRKELP
jgi:pyridinium-3,5-bisthiocarboxylic acid mononucleotide nickel chelatase